MIGFLIALISGALMSVQGVFNTQVTKSSSIWTASAFVQLTALFVCLGAWICTDRSNLMNVFTVQPKYMLLGGAIGAFITYTVIKSMDMLGPAKAVMLIVVAQLAVAYIIELFGWFGVEKQPWSGGRLWVWLWQWPASLFSSGNEPGRGCFCSPAPGIHTIRDGFMNMFLIYSFRYSSTRFCIVSVTSSSVFIPPKKAWASCC